MFKVPEKYRELPKGLPPPLNPKREGFFIIPVNDPEPGIRYYQVIASGGYGWEHVSVILLNEKKHSAEIMPSWDDMCFLKDLFWDDTDCVVQYHPPASEYVNNHKWCLHLWRPTVEQMPMPNKLMVGI